jgi:hypothetical protein
MPSDTYVTFTAWHNLLVMFSVAPEAPSTFELCERNLTTLLRKHPSGVGILLFVMHQQRAPEDYAQRTSALLTAHRSQIRCSTAVIGGRGFAGAAQRALGNSIVALSGMRTVIGMFACVEDASPFIVERILPVEQRVAGQPALVDAVRATRAALFGSSEQGAQAVGDG